MSNNMHVHFVTSGSRIKPSARVRGYNVADRLAKNVAFTSVTAAEIQDPDTERLVHCADVVVFQKVCNAQAFSLFRHARSQGKRCIYDIDDGLFLWVPNGGVRPDRMVRWYTFVLPMIMMADQVIVGGHYLEWFCRKLQKNVTRIPSCIPSEHYQPVQRKQGTLTFGWSGQGNVHKKDLLRFADILETITDYDWQLRLLGTVGDQELHERFDALGNTTCIDTIDWTDEQVIAEEIQTFDVGLMPLSGTLWNRYKCGYKVIQYMGCGVVPIADAVGENPYVVSTDTVGFLIGTELSWEDAIRQVCDLYYTGYPAFQNMQHAAFQQSQQFMYRHWVDTYVQLLQNNLAG